MAKKNSSRKFKLKKFTQPELQAAILRYYRRNPKKRLTAKQLIHSLRLMNSKDSVEEAMKKLQERGAIVKNKDTRFAFVHGDLGSDPKRKVQRLSGRIDLIKSGAAYVVCDTETQDVYVPAKYLNGAFHNDRVLIDSHWPRNRKKPEGRVIEILHRANSEFIGILQVYKNKGIVYINHPKMLLDILIHEKDLNEAEEGDTVLVEVLDFGKSPNRTIRGRIKRILDTLEFNEIEMNSILINNGFSIDFPAEVLHESDSMKMEIGEEELKFRKDFRQMITFTIDPEDAKDFDDALSIQKIDQGIKVGIHIADVSHFVTENSALDKEALRRGNSVYLVDRVCPMLPESLSNDLCSLKPHEDRFCFSVEIDFDTDFNIIDRWFGKSIIHSDHRFSYKSAQELLDKPDGKFGEELVVLNEIARKIRNNRFKKGSINFETEELKIVVDDKGKPLAIETKESYETHHLIEEFMLLANREVSGFLAGKSKKDEVPSVYRIHDQPNIEKLTDFVLFASEYDLNFRIDTPKQIAQSLNELADKAHNDEKYKFLELMAIRTMAKAEYSTNNIGHFGLAFKNYTHFTSPIRRYADLLVHRILESKLVKGKPKHRSDLEKHCVHISGQERKAIDAERDSIRYKQVEFMQGREGEIFTGKVSAILSKGIIVALDEVKVEGLIGYETLYERYVLSAEKNKAIGSRSGKIIRIGDSLEVKLVDIDLTARRINFELIDG